MKTFRVDSDVVDQLLLTVADSGNNATGQKSYNRYVSSSSAKLLGQYERRTSLRETEIADKLKPTSCVEAVKCRVRNDAPSPQLKY
jgi:hypothetical protein